MSRLLVSLAAACILTAGAQPLRAPGAPAAASSRSLADRLCCHTAFPEIFSVQGGVNEFDIQRVDGRYYLAYHPYGEPRPRLHRAARLEDLPSGESAELPPLYYPTILAVNGAWHIWGWSTRDGIEHWVAPGWRGPWHLSDVVPGTQGTRGDPHVRRAADGSYVLAYKYALAPYWAGVMTAPTPAGPWHDHGPVFGHRAAWHAGEEADPAIHFARDGRIYMTFAAWNGDDRHQQNLAMVELDPKYRPIGPGRILLEPTADWHVRHGSRKLFNPVLLEDSDGRVDLFYAQNPSAPGLRAGWGRIVAR